MARPQAGLGIVVILPTLLACHPGATTTPHRSAAKPAPSSSSSSATPVDESPDLPPELPPLDRPTSPPYAGDLSIYEHPQRAERLQIEQVMDLLGITPGKTVADVGAGGGWFSVRAARRVGPKGQVYAVDINPEYVEHIALRAKQERLSNLHAKLGSEDDPGLASASLDAVLLLKTYHELSQPFALLASLRKVMRPSARLGIIDRNGKGDDHGVDEAVVRKEVTRVGFTFEERHDWPSPEERVEYFLVFVR